MTAHLNKEHVILGTLMHDFFIPVDGT